MKAKNNNPNKKDSVSQNKMILEYLNKGGRITPLGALNLFGSLRLSGRIYDLRKRGVEIESKFVELPSGKKVKEYFINQ